MKSERRRRREKKERLKVKLELKGKLDIFIFRDIETPFAVEFFSSPSLITKTSARNEERFLSRIPIERLFGSFAVLEKALLSSPLVLNYLERSR